MAESPHYKELLQLLNESQVEYLIVGGFAIMKYGEPRYTKDLDVWVHNSPQNSPETSLAIEGAHSFHHSLPWPADKARELSLRSLSAISLASKGLLK
jgi:hypothetical protein